MSDKGKFGKFGGAFVPETIVPALDEVSKAVATHVHTPSFQKEYHKLLREFVGRPTPLTYCVRLSSALGSAEIYLKREDLCHTGAHKINNCIGQVLLAQHLGKSRIIAETGAGQHGVATATVCAKFNLKCTIYMGEEDARRQHLNVVRMKLLGAELVTVQSGSRTLKDATNEAIRDWVSNVRETHYIIGSVVGPHPYPTMVRLFQQVIGEEVRDQLATTIGRETPDAIVACVGGGSNAMGIFAPFLEDTQVSLFGVEAGGNGNQHAATLTLGQPGVLHGAMSYLLQDADGQVAPVHSISAGLDYPGVGPEHAYLKESNRVEYLSVTDSEAVRSVQTLSEMEGIIPALETAHAVAALPGIVKRLPKHSVVVLNCSGRGDKDMMTILDNLQ